MHEEINYDGKKAEPNAKPNIDIPLEADGGRAGRSLNYVPNAGRTERWKLREHFIIIKGVQESASG